MDSRSHQLPARLPLPIGQASGRRARQATTVAGDCRTTRRLLVSADLLALSAALLVSVDVLGGDQLRLAAFAALPLFAVACRALGLYERDELLLRRTTLDETPRLFQLATLTTLVLCVLEPHLVDGALVAGQVGVFWAALMLLGLAGRTLVRRHARTFTPERCLYVGDGHSYVRLADKLGDHSVTAELVGRLALARSAPASSPARALEKVLEWPRVDRVIIDPQALDADEMLDFVRGLKYLGMHVSLLPRVMDVVGTSVAFDHLDGVTLMGLRPFGLSRSMRTLKRAFDLAVATLALLALAPVLLGIAVAVRLGSPGPILFRQPRVGRDGRHFAIFKFRTMCIDAEARKAALLGSNEVAGGLFKIADDPRVTRVGRVLRRTSLDELPQLLNVVKGDMSIVGPRPLVVAEDDLVTGYDRRRLQLTPGMTGPWQILASGRVPLAEMVKIDYLYVGQWSPWQDLKIVLLTVPYMLARRNV